METYTTLKRRVLNLTTLTDRESDYLEYCLAAYRSGVRWDHFSHLVTGRENPLLAATDGRITESVWNHPLFQAVRDLEDRLGIAQGEIAPDPNDDMENGPLDDQWVPAPEAAELKGVTLMGLHGAIRRGQLIAKPANPGGRRLVVSANSLRYWQPNPVRQAARRRL
jgi:hypothetical protein